MASSQDIKRRIKSVISTQQITRAMQMIAASKLRKVQVQTESMRDYANKFEEIMHHFMANQNSSDDVFAAREVKRVLYIVIAADRGYCGGFNSNILRTAEQSIRAKEQPTDVIIIGTKARDYFKRVGIDVIDAFYDLSDNPSYEETQEISALVSYLYQEKVYDEIYMVYSSFVSLLITRPTVSRLVPVVSMEDTLFETKEDTQDAAQEEGKKELTACYDFEPSIEEVSGNIIPFYIDMMVYRMILETKTSEFASRMTAMDSATSNAQDMIDKLTLQLNRIRQAVITTEISEIVGGCDALTQ